MGGGETGANPFFFFNRGEIFVLGADRGGGVEGDRKWVRMLVVLLRGEKN